MRSLHEDLGAPLSSHRPLKVTLDILTFAMSLLPVEELTASHRLLWRTSKLPIDIALLCHRGQSRLDRIQCIDELMASLIATVKECILALVQGFSIDSSLLSVQLEYASE